MEKTTKVITKEERKIMKLEKENKRIRANLDFFRGEFFELKNLAKKQEEELNDCYFFRQVHYQKMRQTIFSIQMNYRNFTDLPTYVHHLCGLEKEEKNWSNVVLSMLVPVYLN